MINTYSGLDQEKIHRAEEITSYQELNTEQELVRCLLQKKGLNLGSRP